MTEWKKCQLHGESEHAETGGSGGSGAYDQVVWRTLWTPWDLPLFLIGGCGRLLQGAKDNEWQRNRTVNKQLGKARGGVQASDVTILAKVA